MRQPSGCRFLCECKPIQSLRCVGSLCKVQSDKRIMVSLRPPSRSPLQVQRVLNLFSPLQSVQLCDSESSSEWQDTPSPDWGRPGWGVSRKGLTPLVPSQFVQLCDSESSSEWQKKEKRHTGLYKANRRNEERTSEPVCRADPISPASLMVIKSK